MTSKTHSNDLGSYESFLEIFLRKGYDFVFFEGVKDAALQIVMRHDIDFDTGMALKAAQIEKKLGINATYFFLLRSNFYNVFSGRDYENILAIRELGNTISIHFDPTLYDDDAKGLAMEVGVFRVFFDTDVRIISLHRPNEFFLQRDSPIFGIEHTYQSKYFRDLKYFADSTGKWRFGNPIDSDEFYEGRSLHVLIHPIWWLIDLPTNHQKLKAFYHERVRFLKEDIGLNCGPFKEIEHEL